MLHRRITLYKIIGYHLTIKKKKKKDNKLKCNQMHQRKVEFNKKILPPKLDVQ